MSSKTCLVAIGREDQRSEIVGWVRALGIDCISAGSVERSIELLPGGYDVVIASYDLYERFCSIDNLISAIQEQPEHRRPKIIFYTPSYSSSALNAVKKAGGVCIEDNRYPKSPDFEAALRQLALI